MPNDNAAFEHTRQRLLPNHKSGNDGTGYYIRTFTGRQLYWARVEDHDYDIRDIAHALAMKCRWSGHTKQFYSIAQHSIAVANLVEPEHKLAALLHDASEAYMPDFPSPLKWYLIDTGFTQLKGIEARVDVAIAVKFGLPTPRHSSIKTADILMLGAEHRDLMPHGAETEHMPCDGIPTLVPMSPEESEQAFLAEYYRIMS
jgi:hypothetical protein